MEINNTVSDRIVSVARPQTKRNAAKPSFVVSGEKSLKSESIWQKMASKYDVRNMSTKDIAELSKHLLDAGEISFEDHAILSFDPANIPFGTIFLTEENSTGRYDFIKEYEARINMDKKMKNSQSLVHHERILGYLKRLDTAEGKRINITT